MRFWQSIVRFWERVNKGIYCSSSHCNVPPPSSPEANKGHKCCSKTAASKRRIHNNREWRLHDVVWFLASDLWMTMFTISKWQCAAPALTGWPSGQILRNWESISSRSALAENTFALKAGLCLNACVNYFLMLCICISNASKGVEPENKSIISFQKKI